MSVAPARHHLIRDGRRASTREQRIRIANLVTGVPAVTAIVVFLGLPVLQAVRISLSDWSGVGSVDFSGFGEYERQLASPELYESLLRTLLFAITSAAGIVALATLLAAAVSRNVAGARFYRVVWFIPGVAPAAAVAVYWSTAFQPAFGTVNVVLGYLGLGSDGAWLTDPATAIIPVILVAVWSGVGFAFILILGAMEQIPVSVYEAAQLDGASAVRQFFSVTLPLVRPVLAITATLNLIWSFNNFTIVWGMTQGGPGTSTMTLPVLVYKEAFTSGDFPAAATTAIIAGAILLILGFLSLRVSQAGKEQR